MLVFELMENDLRKPLQLQVGFSGDSGSEDLGFTRKHGGMISASIFGSPEEQNQEW